MNLSTLNQVPKWVQIFKGLINWIAPWPFCLVFTTSKLLNSLSDLICLEVLLSCCVLYSHFGPLATIPCKLAMLFTRYQNFFKFICITAFYSIKSEVPFCGLSDRFNPFILELLNQVWLHSCFKLFHVLEVHLFNICQFSVLNRCVFKALWVERKFFWFVTEEGFPEFLVCSVIVHQHREIVQLNVSVNVVSWHNTVDISKGTAGISGSCLHAGWTCR